MEVKTEGLLLNAHLYLGQQKIAKVFTPEQGLLSIMVKKISLSPFTHPFCHAEWVYKTGREELHLLKDASFLSDLSSLRQNFDALSAAGAIAQDLLKTQLPSKSSLPLYQLTLAYFNRLPQFPHPPTLTSSFRLKLLIHEGLLALYPHCVHCNAPALALAGGESFCLSHAPSEVPFTSDEWETLLVLAYAKRFSLLENIRPTPALQEKISSVFESRIE